MVVVPGWRVTPRVAQVTDTCVTCLNLIGDSGHSARRYRSGWSTVCDGIGDGTHRKRMGDAGLITVVQVVQCSVQGYVEAITEKEGQC